MTMATRSHERNSTRTGETVYQAAVDLMYERGYHGTSLRDVAKAVGVQMSSLYYYYESKQALLVAVMEKTMADLIATVSEAMEAAATPREQLIAGIRAHVMFHASRRKENFIADSELRSLERAERAEIVAMRERYERLFAAVLEDGLASGAFVVADVPITLAGLFAMLNGVATWYRPRGRLSLAEIADQYCTLFLNGVAARRVPIKPVTR
jgi:AcrR family transcriptional regulator